MILNKTYSKEHLKQLAFASGADIGIIERNIYALRLTELLGQSGLDFIFKGGTCLTILLNKIYRLSTDVDIAVPKGTDINKYIDMISTEFPFESVQYKVKNDTNSNKDGIQKLHFLFIGTSSATNKPIRIKLDVLFEDNTYALLEEREIKNSLLLTSEPYVKVKTPSIDCILGDKLTAFGPHCTGVPFQKTIVVKGIREQINCELEVIKQMYDISNLFDSFINSKNVHDTYMKTVKEEIKYRKNDAYSPKNITIEEALMDSINSASIIISRDSKNPEYKTLLEGTRQITSHIYDDLFNAETARARACKVMYLASCILTNNEIKKITDPTIYLKANVSKTRFPKIKELRNTFPLEFAYAVEALKLLGDDVENI